MVFKLKSKTLYYIDISRSLSSLSVTLLLLGYEPRQPIHYQHVEPRLLSVRRLRSECRRHHPSSPPQILDLKIKGKKLNAPLDVDNVPYYRATDDGQHSTRNATLAGSEAQCSEMSDKPLRG